MSRSWRRRVGPRPQFYVRSVLFALVLGLAGMLLAATVSADAPALATVAADTPLRALPGDDSAVLTAVPAGTEVVLTGATAIGYLEATVDGRTGWIAAQALAVSNRVGIPLAAAVTETPILAAPVPGAEVLGTIPVGDVAILTGAHVGQYVAGAYEGTGGWIAEADLGLPYDEDHNGW